MEDPSGTTLTFIAASSFLISAWCSLAKSAQVNFSQTQLEEMLEASQGKKRLYKFLSRSTQILIGTTVLSTLANVGFVLGVLLYFSQGGSISIEDLFFGFLLSFFPLLIFAKALPEGWGRLQPERVMLWIVPVWSWMYWLLIWLIWPLYSLNQTFEKLLGQSRQTSSAGAIIKEILHVVSEGQREGVLQQGEKDMIAGIMELKDIEVEGIMTPRTDMVCLLVEAPICEAISLAVQKGLSRIPLYRENRDDIVGILYIKDLLNQWNDENRDQLKIADLMRKPYFIPETKLIGSLLKELQQQKLHMAIVLDEYGGTAGIVTIEDILEEIVGEILDEYDPESMEPIKFIEDHILEVDARLRVEEVNEAFNVEIPIDEGYETIAGFLCTSMGRIPETEESYHHQNLDFVVLDASERRINRVRIIKPQNEVKNL